MGTSQETLSDHILVVNMVKSFLMQNDERMKI